MKTVVLVFAAVTAIFAAPGEAEAKRRGIPIIIPGMGASETIVLVKDLPNTDLLRRADGKYIDLGYLHGRYSGGEWIGHIGSDTEYINLDGDKLKAFMLVAGLNELPPVPERPARAGGWFMYILFGIGILVILTRMGKFFARFKQRVEAGQTAGQPTMAAAAPTLFSPSQPMRQGPMFGPNSRA